MSVDVADRKRPREQTLPAFGEGHAAAATESVDPAARGFRHRPVGKRLVTTDTAAARLEGILEYEFQDRDLAIQALTHASIADTRLASNERLEFLGDAVLGLVVCELLFRDFDDWSEGDLTKVKSAVVSRRVCAKIAEENGLSDLLILGNGVETASSLPMSLRAAVVEAVIGAVYVDGGMRPARTLVSRWVEPHIARYADCDNQGNFKSQLQHLVQRTMMSTPRYESLDEQGPDHSKCFEVCVVIGGERFPSAWGPSKKTAEQEAARRAIEMLKSREDAVRRG